MAPRTSPKPIPAGALNVYITADSLAFRAQPFIENNILRRLPIQTKLIALDPADEAKKKIGVDNQWLEVEEPVRKEQGYVAAWFVSTEPPIVPDITAVPGQTQTQPEQPKPDGFVVYVSGDNLAVRSSPMIGNNLVKRVPINTQFLVLDPEFSAKQKFGKQDQWLKVRDISGDEGYVAAWCLSMYEYIPPLGPVPATPASPPSAAKIETSSSETETLIVRTTVSDLAFRSQPIILGTTLIKRLPLSTELLVLDPAAEAAAKIGVVNNWIKVRDIQGNEGYVAAWYVVRSPNSSLTEKTG